MNVLLHADGGQAVGLGHATRCGALARALLRLGHQTHVLLPDEPGLADHVGAGNIRTAPLITPSLTRETAADCACHVVVVDSYRWAAPDFASLRDHGLVVVAFDDLGRRPLPVHGVVNGAPAATRLAYEVPPGTEMWLGTGYQVVREEFRDLPRREISDRVERIVAMVGGSDPRGVLGVLAATLDDLASEQPLPPHVEVVCGPYCPVPRDVRLQRVAFVEHPSDLPDRMKRADLALSAAGQTLYELACCGTPTIAFRTGSDQAHNLAALSEAGAVLDTGDVGGVDWPARMSRATAALIADAAARCSLSTRAQALLDGRGADRLAEAIARLGGRLAGPHRR